MKNLIVAVAFFSLTVVVNAQEKTAYEKDTYTLVELLSKPAFESVVDQFTTLVKEENKIKFKTEVAATFPDLYNSLTKIYLDEYSHEEVKQLLKFYNTTLGKKVAGNSTKLAQKGMAVGQDWGMKLQGVVTKYQ